jgi:hypothetical protein
MLRVSCESNINGGYEIFVNTDDPIDPMLDATAFPGNHHISSRILMSWACGDPPRLRLSVPYCTISTRVFLSLYHRLFPIACMHALYLA